MSHYNVTVIPGDGIGPEVVAATRRILDAAAVGIAWEETAAGASVFQRGIASGVPQETIDSIARTRVVLKGPLETPVGFGEKSANVTLRKLFETYGNIRPVRELPGVRTPYSGRGVDLVVVRENVEDLYAGIEHMQTPGVAQCLKLISRKGCEKIIRLGFELARAEGRQRVHCATKANIMKFTEGLMKRTFEEIAPEYPEIEAEHIIIDNCAHQLVKKPEQFEVIITTNMNGDIISDLSSALIGGLGFAPSANIGADVAIFEAVHGSAPKYAGKDVANPTAVILSGVLLLRHLGELEAARMVENAVLATLEAGQHRTRDIPGDGPTTGTQAYADAIIANFGKAPEKFGARDYAKLVVPAAPLESTANSQNQSRRQVGLDVFVEAKTSPTLLGDALTKIAPGAGWKLKMISNRGTQVFPVRGAETDCVDHWRCRFLSANGEPEVGHVSRLLESIESVGYRWMHLEKLQEMNGAPAFTRAQGED